MTYGSKRVAPIGTGRRSSIERLPAAVRVAADAAIERGATVDEVTDLIRALGGTCSRSAVARYARRVRETTRRQRELRAIAESWLHALGADGENRSGPLVQDALRAMVLHAALVPEGREELPTPEEIGRLALALQRIESADTLERQAARAQAARPRAATWPARPRPPAPRRAVEGDPAP